LTDIRPENVKEIIEIASADAGRYKELGWIEVDTYHIEQQHFVVLAWAGNEIPVKP
jgi:hypothetical protein